MSEEISECEKCGHQGWIIAVIGLTTEIVCEKCGCMPYEKDPKDVALENMLIDVMDKYPGTKGKWKKNDV